MVSECQARTHGVTIKNSDRGQGDFCRVCHLPVAASEVGPRTAWARLHEAIRAIESDVRPLYPGSVGLFMRDMVSLRDNIGRRDL